MAEQPPRLFCLQSLLTGEDTVRTMFVSAEIMGAVTPPYSDDVQEALHLSEFRAHLDAFTEGAELSVGTNPHTKQSDAMLARVDPVEDEIWDLRIISPHPGIRALGAFGEFDTFVALTWDYRENIKNWPSEIARFKTSWRALFGEQPPFKGANLDAYLSNYTIV